MKRWAVVSALLLPLPFAAMPLVAIAFNSSAPPAPDDQPVAYETGTAPPESAAEVDGEPLGFRLNTEAEPSCSGLEHGG